MDIVIRVGEKGKNGSKGPKVRASARARERERERERERP